MLGGTNPWISMWVEPRSTIRSIVSTNPNFGVIYLASIYFLQNFFYFLSQFYLFAFPYSFLILAVALSPVFGVIWFYMTGLIFYGIGYCFKGKASLSQLVAAIAWSKIPMSVSLLMWIILLIADQGVELSYYSEGVVSVFIILIALILAAWSWVLLVQSIREIQGFSIGKTLVYIALVYLVVFVLILIISWLSTIV